MGCPTCDHTMHGLGNRIFWCPRCGTLKTDHEPDGVTTPKLVGRCREFGKTLGPGWWSLWHRLGIEESINLPENRRDAR